MSDELPLAEKWNTGKRNANFQRYVLHFNFVCVPEHTLRLDDYGENGR
jgi:hypothetical protein